MTGTGEKTWKPTKRSAIPAAAASLLTLSEEVVEARTASAADHAGDLRQQRILDFVVLADCLHHVGAIRQVGKLGRVGDQRLHGLRVVQPRSRLVDRSLRLLDRLLRTRTDHDVAAGRCRCHGQAGRDQATSDDSQLFTHRLPLKD